MTVLALASVFCLIGVFLTASLGKLASPGSTRRAATQLGVPAWTAPLLVPAEAAVVGLLLVWPAVGAISAGLLLSAFSVVLARVVRDGRPVSCGCFGSATHTPISRLTLARNAALVGLCVPAAFAPGVWSCGGDTVAASLVIAGGLLCVGLVVSAVLQMGASSGTIFARPVRSEI